MDNNMAKGGANTNDQMCNEYSAVWTTWWWQFFFFPLMSMVKICVKILYYINAENPKKPRITF
jgi:hypothetical protein